MDEASTAATTKYNTSPSIKTSLTGETAGRQVWHRDTDTSDGTDENKKKRFTFNPSRNPNSSDQVLRSILTSSSTLEESSIPLASASNTKVAVNKAMNYFQKIQCDDGHWAGDYGGPMFLLPGLICVLYVTESHFPGNLLITSLLTHLTKLVGRKP